MSVRKIQSTMVLLLIVKSLNGRYHSGIFRKMGHHVDDDKHQCHCERSEVISFDKYILVHIVNHGTKCVKT